MKKLFLIPLFALIAFLWYSFFWNSQVKNDFSFRKLITFASWPTITLQQDAKEDNIFTSWNQSYTFRNSQYNYRNCLIGWDFHLKMRNGSCVALDKDQLISEQEAKENNIKYIPLSNRFNQPKTWAKELTPYNYLVIRDWVKIFLWDLIEYAYFPFEWEHLELSLYSFFKVPSNQNKKYYLFEESPNVYQLLIEKSNAQELITQHKQNLKNFQSNFAKYPKCKGLKTKQDQDVCKIYKYIVDNYTYRKDYLNNDELVFQGWNAIMSMQNKDGVCNGYAWAMVYMLQQKGYTAKRIFGLWCGNKTCENHAWVAVKYGKIWKYFDPTFEQGAKDVDVKQTLYFKLSNQVMSLNHMRNVFLSDDSIWLKNYATKSLNNIRAYINKNNKNLEKKAWLNTSYSSLPQLLYEQMKLWNLSYFEGKTE